MVTLHSVLISAQCALCVPEAQSLAVCCRIITNIWFSQLLFIWGMPGLVGMIALFNVMGAFAAAFVCHTWQQWCNWAGLCLYTALHTQRL